MKKIKDVNLRKGAAIFSLIIFSLIIVISWFTYHGFTSGEIYSSTARERVYLLSEPIKFYSTIAFNIILIGFNIYGFIWSVKYFKGLKK